LALEHALMAYEQLQNDPRIADTLVWIYFKKSAYLKAAGLLKEAAEKMPDNPTVLYHYGMALHKNGDLAAAKKTLQASLKLKSDFPGAVEADLARRPTP
jgi:predicted Zn-dependent protease